MRKGILITFEGNDGSGKTTISKQAFEVLKAEGYPVVYTREPGGSDIAEQIRNIVLHPANVKMDARCEALLYAASRRQHLMETILPALEVGKIVLCDRFVDSSLVYQGIARDIGFDEVHSINAFAIEGHWPQATIFLQVSLEIGLQRIQARGKKDRLDNETKAFHTRVNEGYMQILKKYDKRMHSIDANQGISEVLNDCVACIKEIVEAHA